MSTPFELPLRACPFCGSTRLDQESTPALEIGGAEHWEGWIECVDCGTQGPTVAICSDPREGLPTKYQAVRDAWNNRAGPRTFNRELVRTAAVNAGYSQARLARELKVAPRSVSGWLRATWASCGKWR